MGSPPVTVSDDGSVEVHFNWMRDLAALSPIDAARLYAQVATARTFDPAAVDLGSLRRRLEAIAGTITFRDETHRSSPTSSAAPARPGWRPSPSPPPPPPRSARSRSPVPMLAQPPTGHRPTALLNRHAKSGRVAGVWAAVPTL